MSNENGRDAIDGNTSACRILTATLLHFNRVILLIIIRVDSVLTGATAMRDFVVFGSEGKGRERKEGTEGILFRGSRVDVHGH